MHAIDNSVPRFTTVFLGTHIVVTTKLIFEVLCVPRVDHPDYPSHRHLSSISRDELASLFCENAMLWWATLNFSTTEFAKGPRILNMVMIFVITLWSHYNTITEPHACFILSLVEDISIYFPLHVIASILDCYQDTALRDVVWYCFSFSHFMYHSPMTTCTYIVALMMYAFFTFISRVLFLFSLYTYVFSFIQLIYISHLTPWWILFNCFSYDRL